MRFAVAYCYGNGNGNYHGNSHGYSHSDSYGYTYTDSYGNSYRYCNSNFNIKSECDCDRNCDRGAEVYADAQAATYASPTPLSSSV